jgi:hypothetical protein
VSQPPVELTYVREGMRVLRGTICVCMDAG